MARRGLQILPAQAEVTSAVQSATTQALAQPGGAGREAYKPYVGYVAPPPPAPAVPDKRMGPTAAVPVQLGNDAPHPELPQTEMTDVLPTTRYAPSAKADRAAAAEPEVAAARADRIRRLQAEAAAAAARSGQANPPPEQTITTQNAEYTTQPQVAQPATVPGGPLGKIPDTGAQQYPQPRTPPRSSGQTPITRTRPVARTAAPEVAAERHRGGARADSASACSHLASACHCNSSGDCHRQCRSRRGRRSARCIRLRLRQRTLSCERAICRPCVEPTKRQSADSDATTAGGDRVGLAGGIV